MNQGSKQFSPSQLNRLLYQHQTLAELIASIDAHHIRAIIIPGKWTIHDQVAHLASYQPVFMRRINTILHQHPPRFERYVADTDPAFEACRKENTPDLLATLNKDRETLNQRLKTLEVADLQRCGIHPKFGLMNLVEWTEFFLLHEAHHLFAIFQLRHQSPQFTSS